MKKNYFDLKEGDLFAVYGDKYINHSNSIYCLCEKINNQEFFVRLDDEGYNQPKNGMRVMINENDTVTVYKSVEDFIKENKEYKKYSLL
jgi:hypothetical protein